MAYSEDCFVRTDSFSGTVRVECEYDEQDDSWVSVIRSKHESHPMIDGSVWHPILVRGGGSVIQEAIDDVLARYRRGERS